MCYPWEQQRMATEEFCIFLPRHPLPASSATEPLPPDAADFPMELPGAPGVRRSPVVLVVAPELGIEGRLLFVHRLVSVLLAPFGYCRQAPAEPLLHRPHVHCELPSPAACADVRKSRPEGLHLEPLAEPDVNLSAHPAPIKQTRQSYRYPSVQREPCVPWQALVETDSPGPYGL
jgi:hypothetical protein